VDPSAGKEELRAERSFPPALTHDPKAFGFEARGTGDPNSPLSLHETAVADDDSEAITGAGRVNHESSPGGTLHPVVHILHEWGADGSR
jgi:hypothetical protein